MYHYQQSYWRSEKTISPQTVSPIRKLPEASHPYPSGVRGENPQSHKTNETDHMTTALYNSRNWAMPHRATQDGRVMVENSDKMWSTGEEMANNFSILASRIPWTAWKGKKIWHGKMNSPGQEITPERMKRQGQSKNNSQLLMWLVMEVKSDVFKKKKILHRNLEC